MVRLRGGLCVVLFADDCSHGEPRAVALYVGLCLVSRITQSVETTSPCYLLQTVTIVDENLNW